MDKTQLLKKLEVILEEARRTSQWGEIIITLQYGEAVTLRETRTTKLRGGNTHERTEQR